jgi:hypothetical protein
MARKEVMSRHADRMIATSASFAHLRADVAVLNVPPPRSGREGAGLKLRHVGRRPAKAAPINLPQICCRWFEKFKKRERAA